MFLLLKTFLFDDCCTRQKDSICLLWGSYATLVSSKAVISGYVLGVGAFFFAL